MNAIHRPYLFLTVLYFAFLIAIVGVADSGCGAWLFAPVARIPWGDKAGHLLLMGLFSFLLNSALRCRTVSLTGARFRIGSAIAFVLVLGEECSQRWVCARSPDLYDLLFDLCGLCLGSLLAGINQSG